MKLTYTRKIAFNVNGTTIHFTLAIPFKNNLNKLEALNHEKHDSLIRTYYQLQLLVINEISVMSNKTLTFIVHKLCTIKQTHNQFMGGLDLIRKCNFYHASPIKHL